jgi:ADP-ribose pyrophosphatase YjhB (NUDIX family)
MLDNPDISKYREHGDPEKRKNLLSEINKENPFRVPADYFETLTGTIMRNIRQETNVKHRSGRFITSFSRPLRWAAAASIILIITLAVFWIFRSTNTTPKLLNKPVTFVDTLNQDDIAILYFDEDMLVDTLARKLLATENALASDSLTSDDIIKYLIDDEDAEELLAKL